MSSLPKRKPLTLGECLGMPRPCPFVSCRYHFYLNVTKKGRLVVNPLVKEKETVEGLFELPQTCTFDAIRKSYEGSRKETNRDILMTLESIGSLLGITRERVRQIESGALMRMGRLVYAEKKMVTSSATARAKRIAKKVSILDVLSGYGYQVRADYNVEQQFSCDLHGDGLDEKPSARVYEDNTWYCFACDRTRDVVATVMDKEGLSFSQACWKLEEENGFSHPKWGEGGKTKAKTKRTPQEEVAVTVRLTFEDLRKQVDRLLKIMTEERTLPLRSLLRLWEIFDMIGWHVKREEWDEEKGKLRMLKLKEKTIQGGQESCSQKTAL